jgi:hypothetical protein
MKDKPTNTPRNIQAFLKLTNAICLSRINIVSAIFTENFRDILQSVQAKARRVPQIRVDRSACNILVYYYLIKNNWRMLSISALCSMITNDERCTHAIKSRIAVAKTAFNKTSFHQETGLKFKEGTCKVLHLEFSFVWR